MNHKYWLLLSLAPLAPVLSGACTAPFHSCQELRTCARGGAGGASAGEAGNSAGEAGARDSDARGGTAGIGGADETAGGAAGEMDGSAGEGGEGACAPRQQTCSNNGVRTCDADGQYGAASKCTNQTCVVSGTSASCVGNCEPGQTQCAGNGIQTCGANGTWSAATPCAATTPVCVANTCQAPVSCNGLAANCGTASESCCTSPLVTGGSFFRNNDANFPATVSDFRLDKYEVTVGRFRKFVAAVVGGWKPPPGSGKHAHLNAGAGLKNSGASGYELGWDVSWNASLLATKAEWDSALTGGSRPTWTTSNDGSENMPINYVQWFQAAAFCIWDSGFLPSEAEANFARAGGNQQRYYPWSSPPSSTALDCSYANYLGGAAGTDYCVLPGSGATSPVGALSPKGNGRYGQTDLVGNVDEWELDWNADYTPMCVDCANLVASNVRAINGGGFTSKPFLLATDRRDRWFPDAAAVDFGFRCARMP